MRRLTVAVVILALGLPQSLVISLSAQSGNCAECQPPRLNRGWDVTPGDLTICFKSTPQRTWGIDDKNSMQAAFTYWQGVAGSLGKNIVMTFESKGINDDCPTDAVTVKTVPGFLPGVCSAGAGGATLGAKITTARRQRSERATIGSGGGKSVCRLAQDGLPMTRQGDGVAL
jgi:hypothetical protein